MIETIASFGVFAGLVAALFTVDALFARRRARREALPPLRRDWRGDAGD